MGGLLRDRELVSTSKIPLLGDIPVLGWLFKNKTRSVEKVNLLFFMTPKILAPYSKTASANTKEVLDKRSKAMKGMFEADEKDPNQKVTDDLSVKLEKQKTGPLFDQADADYYKNLNEDRIKMDETGISEEDVQETPDYQEIIKSVQ